MKGGDQWNQHKQGEMENMGRTGQDNLVSTTSSGMILNILKKDR